jgi:SET domain-containing protein
VDENTLVHRLTQIYTEKQESKSAKICENLWIKTSGTTERCIPDGMRFYMIRYNIEYSFYLKTSSKSISKPGRECTGTLFEMESINS